jgi:hypothetical protein
MNCKDAEWSSHGMIEVQSKHVPGKEKKTTKNMSKSAPPKYNSTSSSLPQPSWLVYCSYESILP